MNKKQTMIANDFVILNISANLVHTSSLATDVGINLKHSRLLWGKTICTDLFGSFYNFRFSGQQL